MARSAAEIKAELETLRQHARQYDALQNESGEGFNPHAAALRRLEAEYDAAAEAEYNAARAEELATWTPEVTTQRRTAWNAWVSAGRRTPAEMTAWLRSQGWTLADLKTAIQRHGL